MMISSNCPPWCFINFVLHFLLLSTSRCFLHHRRQLVFRLVRRIPTTILLLSLSSGPFLVKSNRLIRNRNRYPTFVYQCLFQVVRDRRSILLRLLCHHLFTSLNVLSMRPRRVHHVASLYTIYRNRTRRRSVPISRSVSSLRLRAKVLILRPRVRKGAFHSDLPSPFLLSMETFLFIRCNRPLHVLLISSGTRALQDKRVARIRNMRLSSFGCSQCIHVLFVKLSDFCNRSVVRSLNLICLRIHTSMVRMNSANERSRRRLLFLSCQRHVQYKDFPTCARVALNQVHIMTSEMQVRLYVNHRRQRNYFPQRIFFHHLRTCSSQTVSRFLASSMVPSSTMVLRFDERSRIRNLFVPSLREGYKRFLSLLHFP